jgi:hypothetical protein
MVKLIYNENNNSIWSGMVKSIVQIFLILVFVIPNSVCADTLVTYDNITTSQYKTFTIGDDQNFGDASYIVYLNNQLLGEYKKGELIQLPDNSNLTIFAPIFVKQDISAGISTGMGLTTIALSIILIFGVALFILWFLWKKYKRG